MTDTTEFPHHELGKRLSNWGRWGDDDEIGTLNFVTPEKRIEAAKLVRTGKVIDLGMPFDKNGPFEAGGFRVNPVHVMTILPSDTAQSPDGLISADDMIITGLQSATQWDGLAHVGYGGYFYNGLPAAAVNNFTGAARMDITKVLDRLVTRGVLLDIAGLHGLDVMPDSYEVTADDLSAAEERQGVKVASGDVVMLRTGWYRYFLEGDRAHFMGNAAGPGLSCCEWLYDREVAALAEDNWTGEVWPSPIEGITIPFHQVAIRDMGLTLGEMFNFEGLAVDCEEDGVWDCMLVAPPLKVTGGVGSPISPLAYK